MEFGSGYMNIIWGERIFRDEKLPRRWLWHARRIGMERFANEGRKNHTEKYEFTPRKVENFRRMSIFTSVPVI